MAKAKTPPALPVIFRAERAGYSKGEVTAVFPTLPGTNEAHTFTVYARVGQHGSGSFGWYCKTRAAKPDEYAALLRELRALYETGADAARLDVRQRFTRHHDSARRAALRATGRPA